MRHLPRLILPFCVGILIVSAISCNRALAVHDLPELDQSLALMTRLESADFSLVTSNPEAVAISLSVFSSEIILPDSWPVEFAGIDVDVPPINPSTAIGISHTNGRDTVVYPMANPPAPKYGDLIPIVIAHYYIPEPRMDLVLLLLAFQSDPGESASGIGIRAVGPDGTEISAPFALALTPEDLSGRFFYDDFIAGTETQRVAAREAWDQGVLLLTRLGPETILSTYVAWY
jgi:hypothetical protein